MQDLKLCESDYRFMSVVWDAAPVSSGELTKLCADKLGWKKSTSYTVLKKLAERGFVQNENATVTALVPRERVQAFESGYVVDKAFGGSLPAFVAAFTRGRRLTDREADELQRLIDEARKGGAGTKAPSGGSRGR